MQSYYQILGVTPSASDEIILAAFHRTIGIGRIDANAHRKLKMILDTLLNPTARQQYNYQYADDLVRAGKLKLALDHLNQAILIKDDRYEQVIKDYKSREEVEVAPSHFQWLNRVSYQNYLATAKQQMQEGNAYCSRYIFDQAIIWYESAARTLESKDELTKEELELMIEILGSIGDLHYANNKGRTDPYLAREKYEKELQQIETKENEEAKQKYASLMQFYKKSTSTAVKQDDAKEVPKANTTKQDDTKSVPSANNTIPPVASVSEAQIQASQVQVKKQLKVLFPTHLVMNKVPGIVTAPISKAQAGVSENQARCHPNEAKANSQGTTDSAKADATRDSLKSKLPLSNQETAGVRDPTPTTPNPNRSCIIS